MYSCKLSITTHDSYSTKQTVPYSSSSNRFAGNYIGTGPTKMMIGDAKGNKNEYHDL